MRMRVLAAPRLQQLPSWIPRQHTAEPKQSVPVGRQMSAARVVPMVAEKAARIARNFMIINGCVYCSVGGVGTGVVCGSDSEGEITSALYLRMR